MKKDDHQVLIRYNPLLPWIFGFVLFISMDTFLEYFKHGRLSVNIMLLVVEVILVIINLSFSRNVLAIATNEGIKIKEQYLVRWDEILSWSYTPFSKLNQNCLEIHATAGDFKFNGFNDFLVNQVLKKYVAEKEKSFMSFKEHLTLIFVGIILFFSVLYGLTFVMKK